MTTQADITLAMTNVNTAATTLSNNINTLINAIGDQATITHTKKLNPNIIAQINACQVQITALIALIGGVAGASAV